MPKQPDDNRQYDTPSYDTPSWPGPVGWWYIPLIWLVVFLAAALAWTCG